MDHLPNTNENELKKQIYETKRLRSVFPVIENLNNLTIEKINQLKNDIPVWNDNTDNNLTLEKFVEKVNNIDAKILEAVKEDLKAKVESIPYPNGTSKEAQDAKKALKDKIQKLTSKAQTDAEYIKLDNLITKINELKQDALSIVNEAEKVAIEKLIDALDNESKVPNIKLAILKRKRKDKIDAISDLSQTEKTNLKTKITNAQNNAEIDKVVDEAKKIAIFNQRKN
ncbi:hypothetical protein [Mycoplasmopsis cynos]|uniref:hypothetical protein n=1 Tax=Mycoplasmopsis cynos TaxID=171284 RepID=UPI0021FD7B9A|nr:hypothetical protein [Mycoplasmopsis cynos]UWV81425.1 hypothetical protein NW065_05845 [Mycoplasmopsis cynos]